MLCKQKQKLKIIEIITHNFNVNITSVFTNKSVNKYKQFLLCA